MRNNAEQTMAKCLLIKVKESLIRDGILVTASKIFLYPISKIRNRKFKSQVLSLNSNEDRFTWIYKNNYWSSSESRSGTGSTLKYTENLRKEFPNLLQTYSIKKVFDTPCGDFNWMRHLLPCVDIEYIGGDIVKPLIDDLNRDHKSDNISFIHFDLIKQIPPQVDLMICRDCLFHLSYEDTRAVLENFIKSKTTYLLTTTHKNVDNAFGNKDILTGDFRCMDLFAPPYCFPNNPLYAIEDWVAPDPERQMCLWNREQIILALNAFKFLTNSTVALITAGHKSMFQKSLPLNS